MRARLRILLNVAREMQGRTTVHGLLHVFLYRGKIRRALWLLLFAAALVTGCIHMVKTMQKYTEHSVTSQLLFMNQEAEFPDVTICNLKPASASIILWGIGASDYMNAHWKYFKHWFPTQCKQVQGESDHNYGIRLRKMCKNILDVVFVSADVRDISHLDKTMLLHCRYNDVLCTHENFSLIQTSNFWNCYTFHPGPEHSSSGLGGRGAELEMILFTDGYNYNFPRSNTAYDQSLGCCFHRVSNRIRDLNRILQGSQPESTGLRVFIHEARSYPLSRSESLYVASGSSVKVTLRPLLNRLQSTPSRRCTNPPLEMVNYVKHFSSASQNVVTKEYTKSSADFVIEAKQKIIHRNCGCFSHKHPFQVNTSELCYYAPPEQWITPSDAVLRRIQCHDEWFEFGERQSKELAKKFRHLRWCEYTRQRAWQQSVSWPPFTAISEIWNDLIVPIIKDGIEFTPADGKVHHIFTRNRTKSLTAEEFRFYSLLLYDKDCLDFFCPTNPSSGAKLCDKEKMRSYYQNASRCVQHRPLAQNMAAISIRLQSPAADVYKEEVGHHWTEALSEIGGCLGLWLGISLVSALELVEFIYELVRHCMRFDPNALSEDDS